MKLYLLKIFFFLNAFTLLSQTSEHQEMKKWLKENNIPILALGIIENAELKKIEVFGNITSNRKAPYNTIFNVASLTKPITAFLTLKLVSQGKWNLDEPLHHYWIDTDIEKDAKTKLLTTRHVLSHQTGFPNWRNGKLKFLFTPGTQYGYSGEGFEYLRKSLEKKFKRSLNSLATELIFNPLKMTDTQYIWNAKTDNSRVSLGYKSNGEPYNQFKRTTPNGADDLLTTIKDYATFLISVMNGDGLSKTIIKKIHSNQVASTNGKHFGLGFEKYHFKDNTYCLAHGGADKGVRSLAYIFPKTKNGLVLFTNSDNGSKSYEKILTQYLGTYGKEIIKTETGKVNISNKTEPHISKDPKLYNQVLKMDKEFFDAYNNCDLKKQTEIYANDIEFFHDKGGFMNSKKNIIKATQKNICGKVTRTLLKEGLEIYPIKDYGVIQIGYHKFYNNQEPNAESLPVKFMIIWNNQNEKWKIQKVISLH